MGNIEERSPISDKEKKDYKDRSFTDENWMIRVNNELHGKYEVIEGGIEKLPDDHRELLEKSREYYQEAGDTLNLIRLEMKVDNVEKANKLVREFLQQESAPNTFPHYTKNTEEMERANLLELKKAYAVSDLASVKKDSALTDEAIKRFDKYGDGQSAGSELWSHEAAASGYYQAWKLANDNEKEKIAEKCVEQFGKVSLDRSKAGDRWWESIAIRQIGKVSSKPEDKEAALSRAEDLIVEYQKRGELKKAALWARDVNDMDPSPEHAERMENLWQKYLDSLKVGVSQDDIKDIRDTGKTYWQLYKRTKLYDETKAEEYRLATIEQYKKLLIKAEAEGDEEKIHECHWVFSELIK
ncbi:MAG: hypothetical protein V1838_05310 [Patescibacteria group bacterium]